MKHGEETKLGQATWKRCDLEKALNDRNHERLNPREGSKEAMNKTRVLNYPLLYHGNGALLYINYNHNTRT